MNIPWEMLFELIASLIEMCMEEGVDETQIRKRIANPSRRDWRRVRRHLRTELGVWGRNLTTIMEDLKEEHRAAGPLGRREAADELLPKE